MSGGSKPDPYYSKDPPKKKANKTDPQGEMKSYKNAVKPLRIVEGADGKKKYYYRCEHCKSVFHVDKRKTAKHAFHGRECSSKWQSYTEIPRPLSKEGRERIRKRTKELWSNPEHKAQRTKAMKKAMDTEE